MKQPTKQRRLLRALAKGDLQALGHLYDAHAPRVYHLLLARGLDEPAAEDVLQDVFLALLDRGAAVAKIDNVQAYLLSIARNMASRYLRRQRHQADSGVLELAEGAASENLAGNMAAQQALRQLPAQQAEVVVLKVWDELTFAEIGEALGISANTAASRYRYAMEKLREIWGDVDDD